jgi:hypothetical protein
MTRRFGSAGMSAVVPSHQSTARVEPELYLRSLKRLR